PPNGACLALADYSTRWRWRSFKKVCDVRFGLLFRPLEGMGPLMSDRDDTLWWAGLTSARIPGSCGGSECPIRCTCPSYFGAASDTMRRRVKLFYSPFAG